MKAESVERESGKKGGRGPQSLSRARERVGSDLFNIDNTLHTLPTPHHGSRVLRPGGGI